MRLKSFLFGIIFVVFANCVFAQDVIPIQAKRNAIVEECKKYIGTPYLYGGLTKDGIDCSGFVFTTVRDSAGIQLPRTVKALYSFVQMIPDSKKQKGDLVFFRTVESTISHVGIYIGKDQFMHSVSDGPNTGVIVSSLKENYWKTRYAGVGTFFPVEYEETNTFIASNDTNTSSSSTTTSNNKKKISTFSVDSSLFLNWNFLTTDQFLFNVRGVTFQVHGVYNKWILHPGFGIDFKYEPKMNIFQIPMYLSLSPKNFFRIYSGVVFTIGKPVLIGSGEEINSSIFPGILGISFQTPSIQIGKTELRFVQDLNYTIFNKKNNFALNFVDSVVAGLVFQSGIRIGFDI
jgi:hypothetical protein